MKINHRGTEDTETHREGIDDLSGQIIGAAIEVHKALGPGLLELAYEACFARELTLRGLRFDRQVPIPVEYKGVRVEAGYRLDVIVEKAVVVDLKAVERLEPIHDAQLLTYLRLTGLRLGLLINFNVPVLVKGVKRLVNG